jgi:hypothetical protein
MPPLLNKAKCGAVFRYLMCVFSYNLLLINRNTGAILMCDKASIHDPEIKELCQEII